MSRARVSLLLPLAGVVGALLAPEVGTAAPAAAGAGPALRPCAGLPEYPRARCGSIRVPLDRANPGLGTTTVAFALVRRRDTSRPSLGTIVPNPGGPGVAAIGGNEAPFGELFAPLLDRRDLLLVDPRGTGRSNRLTCRALQDPGLAFAPREQLGLAIGACGRELGPRAGLYGSAAVADDIEDVRAALGLERLDLWGASYGSFLMPVYAARHPEHVRSLVLSGGTPVNFDPWARDSVAAMRRAIRLVCARTRACRGEAVLRDIARVAERLRARSVPFTIRVGDRRFRSRLDESTLAAIVFAGGNPRVYGRIPAAVAGALADDLAPLRRLAEADALGWAGILAYPFFSLPQNVATNCHDYPRVFSYGDTLAARLAAYEGARAALGARAFWPFSPAAWTLAGPAGATCLAWPNDPGAASPLPPGTALPDVPVLVLSGDLDANATSHEGRRTAAQFRRATFVEIPNSGHTPTGDSPCAAALGLRFVATLRANPRACAGTGTPPAVAAPAPLRASALPLVRAADATPAERRALALVVATAVDLQEQAGILELVGSAAGLRGGRYVVTRSGTVRLVDVQVVRDARVAGVLAPGPGDRLAGTVRLTGSGVPRGRLRVQLDADGSGRAKGVLGGRPIELAFRA